MTIEEILNVIDGTVINNVNCNLFNGISIDTRTLKEDELLICLNDAYKYVSEDIKCAGIIVDTDLCLNLSVPIIKVDNTFDTLLLLGKYYRGNFKNIPLIAITGSVGKTTTKELIYEILSVKFNVLKSEKNYNNHIGLPLTLSKLNDSYNLVLVELGMNHAGEISKLSKIAQPDLAIITNIGTAHIGNLGSSENIKMAKMEIVDGLSGPLLVSKKYDVNFDDIIYLDDFSIHDVVSDIDGTSFKIYYNNREYLIKTKVIGTHLIENILISIQIGLIYNIDMDDIISVVNKFELPDKRLNVYKNRFTLIDDTYNASYESVIGILKFIKDIDKDKIIILGDILELGDYSKTIHLKINDYLKKMDSLILLVGEETKNIDGIHFCSNDELIDYLRYLDLNNKLILIKGSRRMNLEIVRDFILKGN